MLEIVAIIAAIAVVLIVVVLIYAATKPDTFRIQRTASIKAPPEKIFALLNDFHLWPSWSPWEKMDSDMKRTLSGASSGKGAVYAWDGNSKVGQGRMEIIDASPPSRLAIKLDFLRPFEAHNMVEFTLVASGDATNLTWAMNGPLPYMAKVMHVFFNMDRMVGKDFETGLANLKTIAEK
jgi:uncharacterized protein YndB with AHSA1/START domain